MGKNDRGGRGRRLRPRLRVMKDDDIVLGPGRVELLELIDETGSLRSAASQMGVSYMRAWKLVKSMNRYFRKPVVEVIRGGKSGGGARLTDAGKRARRLYRAMETDCLAATKRRWPEMRVLLRP